MGVLLGRLWEIILSTDQLPGSKELVGGIEKLFAYEVTMRCLCFAMEPMQIENYFRFGELEVPSHAFPFCKLSYCLPYGLLGSLSVSELRQRVHIWKMLCTLFFACKCTRKTSEEASDTGWFNQSVLSSNYFLKGK